MSTRLFLGDCLAFMPALPAGSVDMVLTDLPYGTTQSTWDAVIPFEPLWQELERLCPAGAIVLFAAQPFTSALVMSRPSRFRHEWIWRKNKGGNFFDADRRPMRRHEDILVFGPSDLPYQPQKTTGHRPMNAYTQTSSGSGYGATKRPSGGGATERYPETVLEFDVVNNDDPFRGHPNQKPVDLLCYLIETYSAPGQMVLDCTMGSGSTGEACQVTGRSFIGIESDPEFFAFAERRLQGPLRSRAEARRSRPGRQISTDLGPLFGAVDGEAA